MAGDLVPETTQVVHEQRDRRAAVELPRPKDYRREREEQRVAQRALLERLRYRGYERRGTLGGVYIATRGFLRANVRYVGWVIYAYLVYRFAHIL